MAQEVAGARARGVSVEGICLYPVDNHRGWDDGRDCSNGLLGQDPHPHGSEADAPPADPLQRLRRQYAAWSRPYLTASG